jgi:hypothetical protein
VVIISIVAFKLFGCAEFHSEFQPLEVTRHTPLTDRMSLHYFELPKLPKTVSAEDSQKLWLALFRAETEEELKRIEALGVLDMEQAIGAYRHITTTDEFRELEQQRWVTLGVKLPPRNALNGKAWLRTRTNNATRDCAAGAW